MDDRTKIPPGLPRSNPTVSYWQDPPDGIADLRTTNDLPQQADYVIIGSGISGACIAYNLLCKKPNASVVILEARQDLFATDDRLALTSFKDELVAGLQVEMVSELIVFTVDMSTNYWR